MNDERIASGAQQGPAIHSEALTGDPEGFGDRTLPVPTTERRNGGVHVSSLAAAPSTVTISEIVRDDPLGYANIGASPVFESFAAGVEAGPAPTVNQPPAVKG